jgi:hypothetical protein
MLKVVKKIGMSDVSHQGDVQTLNCDSENSKIYSGGEDGYVKVRHMRFHDTDQRVYSAPIFRYGMKT